MLPLFLLRPGRPPAAASRATQSRRESKSPPCRTKRDKDGAPSGSSVMALLRSEGAPDRNSYAEDVIGMEFEIVGDEIVVGLGAHEECSPHVITHSYTGVHQEVRVVDVAAAAGGVDAFGLLIEQQSLATHSGHKVGANFWGHGAGIDGVDVVQSRAVVLVPVVEALLRPERTLYVDPESLFREVLQAGTGVNPAFFWGRKEGLRSSQRLSRPERAAPDSEINLLGRGEGDQGCKNACEPQESSSQLPVLSSQRKSHTSSQPAIRGFVEPVEDCFSENGELRTENSLHRSGSLTLDQWCIRSR